MQIDRQTDRQQPAGRVVGSLGLLENTQVSALSGKTARQTDRHRQTDI